MYIELKSRLLGAGSLERNFSIRLVFSKDDVIDRILTLSSRVWLQNQPYLAVGTRRQNLGAEQFLNVGEVENIETGAGVSRQ